MNNPNAKIIAFVGMPGAGKSSAVDYLTKKGYPKVYFGGVILQAVKDSGLEPTQANERMMRSWTEYKYLKHEFPGEMSIVAILAPRHLRHHRLSNRPVRPLQPNESLERDWAEIENLEKGGPIAVADHYIINDGDLNNLYTQVDKELNSLHFYN